MHRRGRWSGECIDYGELEEELSRHTSEIERDVHEVALNALDVDVPFVKLWGKTYRRAHRAERGFETLAGPARVTRTLQLDDGRRRDGRHGAQLDGGRRLDRRFDRRRDDGLVGFVSPTHGLGASREPRRAHGAERASFTVVDQRVLC